MLRIIKRNILKLSINNNRSFSSQISKENVYDTLDFNQTHEVFNQAEFLKDFNVYDSDPSLKRIIDANINDNKSKEEATNILMNFGKNAGNEKYLSYANNANADKNKPILKQFDSHGRRIDVVDYVPDYHYLMKHSLESGCAGFGYNKQKELTNSSHIIRSGLIYMANQLEPGHCCPVVMTAAAIPALDNIDRSLSSSPWNNNDLITKLMTPGYDHRDAPISEKNAITMGMSMTEKQGGSDVRANTTMATPIDSRDTGHGNSYYLKGHKWFTSAPMSDAFLTLSYTPESKTPSCFLVPRWLPDGTRNRGFQVMRLKDKLADRANASSEVEYHNAWGTMIGNPGKGVKTIIEMVTSTRLDCALGSAGGMRRALHYALHHTQQRTAFGAPLIQQPLMKNLLADLCLEVEAHTVMAMSMASLWDKYQNQRSPSSIINNRNNNDNNDNNDDSYVDALRVGIAVSKYYTTKRCPGFTYECMEIFGGNGFVEDFPMARLFRHSPLNSIWEGSGNVICLDILRAAGELPGFLAFMQQDTTGCDARLDALYCNLNKDITAITTGQVNTIDAQIGARLLADKLALALQASSLIKIHSPLAELFCNTRLPATNTNTNGSNEGAASQAFNYGSSIIPTAMVDALIDENTPKLY